MRRLFLSILILFFLIGSRAVFGQGEGQGKGEGGKRDQAQEGRSSVGVEPNSKSGPVQGSSEQMERREKARQMRRQRAGADANMPAAATRGRAARQAGADTNMPAAAARERAVRPQAAEKAKAAGPLGAGREHQQQLGSLEQQLAGEQAKHQQRVAKLQRIRELAAAENQTETVQRVDKLLEKESKRYDRKRLQMQQKLEKIPQLGAGSAGEKQRVEDANRPTGRRVGRFGDRAVQRNRQRPQDQPAKQGEEQVQEQPNKPASEN